MVPEVGQTRKQFWSVCQTHQNSTNQANYVAAGFDNGDIKVFDVRNSKIAWETSLSRGVSKLCVIPRNCDKDDKSENILMAGTVQGKMYTWNMLKPADTPLQQQLDKGTVWEATSLSQNKNLVVTVLGTGAMVLVNLEEDKINKLLSHQVSEPPLTGLSASQDKPGLIATSSFDKTIRLFYYTGLK